MIHEASRQFQNVLEAERRIRTEHAHIISSTDLLEAAQAELTLAEQHLASMWRAWAADRLS